jgi:hypothetical protein
MTITIGGEEVMTVSEKAELLQQALGELNAWRKRYADVPELGPVIEVVDETILSHAEIVDDSVEEIR